MQELPTDTSAYRLIDDERHGVSVDLFSDVAIVSFFDARNVEAEKKIVETLRTENKFRSIYLKRRPKSAHADSTQKSEHVSPTSPEFGEPVESLTATECGIKFEIKPSNGLSVGLYLDARDARQKIRSASKAKEILNLYAYTCGFGVSAALGGAKSTTNIDLSKRVLDWGKRNYALNKIPLDTHQFLHGDTFDWLARLKKKSQMFDGIVLDPPSFSTFEKKRFSVERDYSELLSNSLALLRPGGFCLAACNLEKWNLEQFSQRVKEVLHVSQCEIAESFGASKIDFKPPSRLKCLWLKKPARSQTNG